MNHWNSKEEQVQTLFFANLARVVLMNLVLLLQSPMGLNPFFKFLQAMSIVNLSKSNQSRQTRHSNPGNDDGESDDDDDDDDEPFDELIQVDETSARSISEIGMCRSSTLNGVLSALRYFTFGCLLINYDCGTPIDSYVSCFKDGLIFAQISMLLYQVQKRNETQSNKNQIFIRYDDESKVHVLSCIDGSIDVVRLRETYMTLMYKFKVWFDTFFEKFDGDQAVVDLCRSFIDQLVDPSQYCDFENFHITTSNHEPLLKGPGFEKLKAVTKNVFEKFDLHQATNIVEEFKSFCLALVYYASGSNVRHFDLCRLFVHPFHVENGSLQIGGDFGLYMNATSIKYGKNQNMFSLFFDRAQVLLAYAFIILTQEVATKFTNQMDLDFAYPPNEKEWYKKKVTEQIFQQQVELEYGNYLQKRLKIKGKQLAPAAEVPIDAHLLKEVNFSRRKSRLLGVLRDVLELNKIRMNRIRKLFCNTNFYLPTFIQDLCDSDLLSDEMKNKVDQLDGQAKKLLDESKLQQLRGDVSFHEEKTRNNWYAARECGTDIPAHDTFKIQQNLEFKSIFFNDMNFSKKRTPSHHTQSFQSTSSTSSISTSQQTTEAPQSTSEQTSHVDHDVFTTPTEEETSSSPDHYEQPMEHDYFDSDIETQVNPFPPLISPSPLSDSTVQSSPNSMTASVLSKFQPSLSNYGDVLNSFKTFASTKFDYTISTQVQHDIIHWYLMDSNDCLIRTGTGSGKTSLILLLTKFTPRSINIILVPFQSLISSVLESCKKFEIEAHPFSSVLDSGRLLKPTLEGIIVVCCTEQILSDPFKSWLHEIARTGTLVKLIVDEVHSILEHIVFREAVS
jgi:hypothetical protein